MKYRLFLLMTGLLMLGCQSTPDTDQERTDDSVFADTQLTSNTAEDADLMLPPKEKEKEMYENTNRMVWQKPEMIIEMMGDLEGKVIADIGAGTGFFAKRLAQRAGKVIAIDIDQRFLNYIDSLKVLEISPEAASRLETRLAVPNHPNLKPGEADIILIVNTFMYIPNKKAYLKILHECLADEGRLFIIDFKKKRTEIGPPSEVRLPLHEIEELLYETGYEEIKANDTALDYQYIISGQKN